MGSVKKGFLPLDGSFPLSATGHILYRNESRVELFGHARWIDSDVSVNKKTLLLFVVLVFHIFQSSRSTDAPVKYRSMPLSRLLARMDAHRIPTEEWRAGGMASV